MQSLALNDLQPIDDEPRVLDLRLAEALEFGRPRDIRQLIERNRLELETHGVLRHGAANSSDPLGRGRPATEYWLNEAQLLVVCMRSDALRAQDVRGDVIAVFKAWRHGKLVPNIPSLNDIGHLFDQKLAPVQREIANVRLEISDVQKNVVFVARRIDDIVPRRDFSKETQQQWFAVIRAKYDGDCPCCRQSKIAQGDSHCDHFVGRELNGPEHGWMICRKCHLRLHGDDEFKNSRRVHFQVFQDYRRDMFSGVSQSKRRKASPTITGQNQGELF